MILSIIILAYLLLIHDIIEVIIGENSNLLLSSALVVLIFWQYNTTWGITMLCILGFFNFIALLKPR